MLKPDYLILRRFYYSVRFFNRRKNVPKIKTYVYIGKNINSGTQEYEDRFYFQEEDYCRETGRYFEAKQGEIISLSDKDLSNMYDLGGLIDLLKSIRKETPPPK